eukprot:scaffold1720_cov353-Pavlova_lutheri.AAC.11
MDGRPAKVALCNGGTGGEEMPWIERWMGEDTYWDEHKWRPPTTAHLPDLMPDGHATTFESFFLWTIHDQQDGTLGCFLMAQ